MARFPEEQTEMYFWRHKLPEQIYEKNSFANLMAHTPESEMKAFAHEIFEKLPPELQNQQDMINGCWHCLKCCNNHMMCPL